jgi:class 3 adenylate cyclase
MQVCGACGQESQGEFAFCPYCGAPLEVQAEGGEQRKTVTVLFCDVTGSTSLGESIDPETLRALLARYFARMKDIIEAHGGTVEKFIGDAVMAVFGVPRAHEDDALRAVRAAREMRDALPGLGVQARIGINTGEVVTGTHERLATGDAVNVAARLEQAAAAGEILLGEETLALVRNAVTAEPLEPLELKGKADAVRAHRLVELAQEVDRRHDLPLVGRERDLDRLEDAFAHAVETRTCHLFTVLGVAGIGKSRLAHEFLDGLEAQIVQGRCLSYGEGITYWPIVQVLRQLEALPSDPAAATALRSLLGESDEQTSADEIAWSFRKLLEEQAQRLPVVCVLDDVQWGQETFLELVEHLADLSRDAPLLVLCLGRPELLDVRPGWAGGKFNATTLLLQPLAVEQARQLLEELGGVEPELATRIVEAAEGNPLFVEEMLALVRGAAGGVVAVPPTIQALLAARLDQLESTERTVLACGAVEGRVFHREAVEALARDEADVSGPLLALVRKELIRPDGAEAPGDDAFRFTHQLLRDAAYEGLTKSSRAELHERFADWLEERAQAPIELDEILGYHLEQAARYRQELGEPAPALAERAANRHSAAGRRALARGDLRAAAALLSRALELTRPVRLDVTLELDLADALRNDPDRSAAIAAAAASGAEEAGDEAAAAAARVVFAQSRNATGDATLDELETAARAAMPLLEQAGDDVALARVFGALGQVANARGRWDEWAEAAERAIHHAGVAGRQDATLFGLGSALAEGARPADEALRALDAHLPHGARLLRRAELLAQVGRFDEAWSLAREESQRLLEMSGDATGYHAFAEIAALEGDHEAAAEHLRRFCDYLEEHHQRAVLSTHIAELGRELCALGRYEEAEPLARLGRDLGDADDVVTQVSWRLPQALVLARRGDHAEAERLAREAVALAEQTDMLNLWGEALTDLSEVLAVAGRSDEAAIALEEALACYGRKRNLAMLAQLRPRLEAMRG